MPKKMFSGLMIGLSAILFSVVFASEVKTKHCYKSEVRVHIQTYHSKSHERFVVCMQKDNYIKFKKANGLEDEIIKVPGSTLNIPVGGIINP